MAHKVGGDGDGGERFEYSGWVYHLGVNKIGREYCHFRFLSIRGKYMEMYKRDPQDNPGIVYLSLRSPSRFPFVFSLDFCFILAVNLIDHLAPGLRFLN